jgi:cephalosporin hydroxylase
MRDALPEDDAIIQAFAALYDERGCWARTEWLGKRVAKSPMDLWVYQELLCELRPDVLLESGTSGAGSAHFFARVFDLLDHGQVVTVDVDEYRHLWLPHPRITYLVGDVLSDAIGAKMRLAAETATTFGEGKVFVSLDAAHTYEHVRQELEVFAPLVSPGSYLVVEDVGVGPLSPSHEWCGGAVMEFLAVHPEYADDASANRHLLSAFKWLRRIA